LKIRLIAAIAIAVSATVHTSGAAQATSLVYHASDNGRTFSVAKGLWVNVDLSGIYWKSKPIKGVGSYSRMNIPNTIDPGCQIPGAGCGLSHWRFKLSKTGTYKFTATRNSCGEAIKCATADKKFDLKFIVK
jgi:hypothetical protein